MTILPLNLASDLLRRNVPGSEEAVERCELILEQQHQSLRKHPPPSLSEAVRLAATPRLRAREVVIERDRFPMERARIAEVMARIARGTLADSAEHEDQADALVGLALPRVLADDGRGVLDVPGRLGLAVPPTISLLREALKPELLRVSMPFQDLIADEAPPATRCPLCGAPPAFGTEEGESCCRWCGTFWQQVSWACTGCGGGEPRGLDVSKVVASTRLMSCSRCGEVTLRFALPPDPLLLSLHAALAAPLLLAARIQSGAQPTAGFAVF